MNPSTYVIAGGSSGIGLEIVKKLLEQGHQVINISRHFEDPVRDNLMANHSIDLVGSDAIPELPDEIHGLVYCPGSIRLKPFRSLRQEDFLEDLRINYLGAVRLLQHAEKALKKGMGSVVLFSTVAVAQGMPFHASIAGAKGAVEGLTRSLAAEWAPAVRVNAIAPSLTQTPLADKLLSTQEKIEANGARHPLKRVGQAAEMANMAQFLLNKANSWITGQVIAVDGGMSSLRV